MDFASPLVGKMYLIVVHAFSEWPKVVIMDAITTSKTIDALRDMYVCLLGTTICIMNHNLH